MDVCDLLPKEKHDTSTVEALLQLSDVEIEPILPELLTWVQDINWSIAIPVFRIIAQHQEVAEPYILEVLRGRDEVWKYNIIERMLYEWNTLPCDELTTEIARIAWNPTPEEAEAEVDKIADEFIDSAD